jgi:hypothetical protein
MGSESEWERDRLWMAAAGRRTVGPDPSKCASTAYIGGDPEPGRATTRGSRPVGMDKRG